MVLAFTTALFARSRRVTLISPLLTEWCRGVRPFLSICPTELGFLDSSVRTWLVLPLATALKISVADTQLERAKSQIVTKTVNLLISRIVHFLPIGAVTHLIFYT